MPLFNFRLKPLPELIESWRWNDADPTRYLKGWFWLSYGWYWLETPQGDVPTNHPEFNAAFGYPPDEDPHLDYQVARFLMDWQDIMPSVLEPLPEPVAGWVESGAWMSWHDIQRDMRSRDDAPEWETYAAALGWWSGRHLDVGYLAAGPRIHSWRTADTVTLVWDTRECRVNGHLCWVESRGQVRLPLAEWLREWSDFETRLEREMRERLHEVEALGMLSAEQMSSLWEQHGKYFPGLPALENTDWNSVLVAIRLLEQWSGQHLPR